MICPSKSSLERMLPGRRADGFSGASRRSDRSITAWLKLMGLSAALRFRKATAVRNYIPAILVFGEMREKMQKRNSISTTLNVGEQKSLRIAVAPSM